MIYMHRGWGDVMRHLDFRRFICNSNIHLAVWRKDGGLQIQITLFGQGHGMKCKYRVRQRGCSLTHSARTPPAVHPGITNWVDEIELEKKKNKKKVCSGIFRRGGGDFCDFFLFLNEIEIEKN